MNVPVLFFMILAFPQTLQSLQGARLSNSVITLPNEFKCPISLELMTDPVVASDGYTYERDSIEKWQCDHSRSPMTNEPLQTRFLVQNRALRNLICEWRAGAENKVVHCNHSPHIFSQTIKYKKCHSLNSMDGAPNIKGIRYFPGTQRLWRGRVADRRVQHN